MSTWLDDQAWETVQAQLPIACVDVLVVSRSRDGAERVGLIKRATPHQGPRWCLVGGRLRRGESLVEAAVRELGSALLVDGDLGACLVNPHDPVVAEYAPRAFGPGLHDPRKHAVAMNFVAHVEDVQGTHGPEALEFAWFDPAALDSTIMGFGQELLLPRLLSLPSG